MDYKSAYNKMQALFYVFSVNRFPVFFLFLSLSAIWKIQDIMVISIDHHSASQLINPLKSITVIGMYMPVYKQIGLVFFNQDVYKRQEYKRQKNMGLFWKQICGALFP